jgi:hypothetical protein
VECALVELWWHWWILTGLNKLVWRAKTIVVTIVRGLALMNNGVSAELSASMGAATTRISSLHKFYCQIYSKDV